METKIYSNSGKEKGTINLPEEMFGLKWNADLVHQVVVSMISNKRSGTADTKGRGEVRGGGRKPWKQKGTGQARHGSIRSPIWVGGGVTHGPLAEKNYKRKINKKMRVKALYTVLSEKFKNGQVLFVEDLEIKDSKTKSAQSIINAFSKIKGFEKLGGKNPAALLTIPKRDESVMRAVSNIPTVNLEYMKDINPAQVLAYKYLIISSPEESVKILSSRSVK